MRIGLIGAGAVGGVLAQKLYKEFEFFLIVDDKRKGSYTEFTRDRFHPFKVECESGYP